ncbi:Na(+)/H(+) antiporter subunit C [Gracilibacillus alcaliphilus]|uniref:Na(+)/H(+) antiporter subunit C n=1 Tax=Gracilibacillus alcaliphilus TaxID=1401441 RepID=UPI00195EB68C|nr:Na(+)/H(+) antiporter subunit C [Gracilibacillus alcaliphilus]MBM7677000.1 multicomponent Na+:H+ antiporter subunit C [Gracilibacillus alcaliphilus]
MEVLMAIMIGIIFMVSIYLMMSRNLLRVAVATLLLSHGVHLLLLTMPGLQRGDAPILSFAADAYTDPLPHALILTAIVISFAVTSLLLVMAYRTYKVHKTDDLEDLRGSADE